MSNRKATLCTHTYTKQQPPTNMNRSAETSGREGSFDKRRFERERDQMSYFVFPANASLFLITGKSYPTSPGLNN